MCFLPDVMAPFLSFKELVEKRWWVVWGVGTVGDDGLMFIAGGHVLSDWLCDEPQSETAERL